MFIGPPGVGKTTTIAKIAAQERARKGRPLGLVGADGFRAGAVEQLRTYASIIGAPFRIARTIEDLEQAIVHGRQSLLVDTAGRSPHDGGLRDLRRLLGTRRGIRTHLVLAADTSASSARRILDAYDDARPDRIVISKVDEAESLSPLLERAARARAFPCLTSPPASACRKISPRDAGGVGKRCAERYSDAVRMGGGRMLRRGRSQERTTGTETLRMRTTTTTAPPEDLATRDKLVMEHVGLVKAMASRLANRLPSQVEVSELISVGVLGLIDAAGRFKPSLGVPFDAFARRRIQGAMLDSLRDLDWAPRALRKLRRDVDAAMNALRAELKREPEAEEIAEALGVSESEYDKMLDQLRSADLATIRQASVDDEGSSILELAVDTVRRPAHPPRARRAATAPRQGDRCSCPSASATSWRSTTKKR